MPAVKYDAMSRVHGCLSIKVLTLQYCTCTPAVQYPLTTSVSKFPVVCKLALKVNASVANVFQNLNIFSAAGAITLSVNGGVIK